MDMKTNRDEILKSALQLFMSVNYEKASLQMVTKKVGLTKTGIFNYFSTKQELFIAVADKFLFDAQNPKYKFERSDGTLKDFIKKYVQGVKRTMAMIAYEGDIKQDLIPGKSPNSGYFHFLQQVYFYYPDSETKLRAMLESDYAHWRSAVCQAIQNGEINADTNIEESISLFRHVYMGLSYDMSFFEGLDTNLLEARFNYIYSLLKR